MWRFASCGIEVTKLVFGFCFSPKLVLSIPLNYSLFEGIMFIFALKYNFRTTLKYNLSATLKYNLRTTLTYRIKANKYYGNSAREISKCTGTLEVFTR